MVVSNSQKTNWNVDVDQASSMVMTVHNLLTDYASDLLRPSRSKKELLLKLDKLEHLLSHISKRSQNLVEVAFQSSKEALTTNDLVKHVEVDVRVSVTSCMSEIIRITAPNEPFEEDQMKVFFQLANSSYEHLSCMGGRAYSKALSIIETVSCTKACLLMLDLEFYDLVLQMFHLFFKNIRTSHPEAIFTYMENIMTLVINDSVDCNELLVEIVIILLCHLMKENKSASPTAFQLAKKVFLNCVDDLKTHLPEGVKHWGIPVEHYDSIIASVYKDATQNRNVGSIEMRVDATCHEEVGQGIDRDFAKSTEDNVAIDMENNENFTENQRKTSLCLDKKKASLGCTQLELKQHDPPILKRSIRRPKHLLKPEEGYEHWILGNRTTSSDSPSRKNKRKRSGRPYNTVISKEPHSSSRPAGENSDAQKNDMTGKHKKTRQVSSVKITFSEKTRSKSTVPEDLIGDMMVETSISQDKIILSNRKTQSGERSGECTTSKEKEQETITNINASTDVQKSSKLSKRELKERWRLMLAD